MAARKVAISGSVVIVLAALCVVAGRSGLFTPTVSAILIGVIVIIAGHSSFVPALRRLTRRAPVLLLTERGVELHDGIFARLGPILWRDIVAACEFRSRGGRLRYLFFVREPDDYIDRIESARVRAKVRKLGGRYLGSLAWVLSRDLDDPTVLKKAVAQVVAPSRAPGGDWQGGADGWGTPRIGGSVRPSPCGLRARPGRWRRRRSPRARVRW